MIDGRPEPSPPGGHDPQYGGGQGEQVDHLLHAFEANYAYLLERLAGRLRSSELAADVLHDAYLKLKSNPAIGDVQSPRAYVYRMAINLAKNEHRRQNRFVSAEEARLSEFPDPAPSPDRAAIASLELHRAVQTLRSLPPTRREIFLAKWRDGKSQAEIAAQFRIHKRTVQKELYSAEQYLRKALRRHRKP
jgi:RNA polymerase sigma-70 factor (ECF subfamily)